MSQSLPLPHSHRPTSGARILIIEDEMLIRWSLAERLAEAGFCVVEAETGAAGRASFTKGDVALVVLDIRLPDADGLSLLKEFRAHVPPCPVLIISAHATSDVADHARAHGATDLVAKPFDVEDVLERIQRALPAPSEPAH